MELDYLIMHGAGNRILVVDSRDRDMPPPPADTLRRLADAATGPGFDQLMWVFGAEDPAIRFIGAAVEHLGLLELAVLLAQSAQPLADALPGVDVKMPEVMETVEI